MHHHCGEATTANNGQKAPHGSGCPCCASGACTCLHLCANALTPALVEIVRIIAVQSQPLADSTHADAVGARQLRPPIV